MQDTHNNDLNSILVKELLKEKRSDRRWRNFRFICWFLLIGFLIISSSSWMKGESSENFGNVNDKRIALVRLSGMIGAGKEFSAEEVIPVLHKAFKDTGAAGVVLDIDSPGGTPVQASIIHDAILNYKKMYHKKVVVVGEDMLTSGAYYVAVSADKIYVNPNTITGSIGVIMKGFGFVDALKKLGIERRVYTSGNNKDRLDPFLPQNPEDLAKVNEVEHEVHDNFVAAVVAGRKGKLQGTPEMLFNGDFWSGTAAKKLGLVDDVGNLMDAMQKEFGTEKYKEYGSSNNYFHMLGVEMSTMVDNIILRLS